MPAFAGAIEMGYRYIETDVQLTADGVLVAFHDNDLARVTNRSGLISELPWSEVSRALVDGREPIPLLEDLLGSWPEVRINIDAKRDETVEPLAATLRRTGAVERVCVGSFSDKRVRRIRAMLGPALCTALGPAETARARLASMMPTRTVSHGAGACLQVPTRFSLIPVVDSRMIDHAHAAGLCVHVWTIDDASEMDRLLDLGVDGIMTDRPAVLKETLQRRGQWA